MLGTSNIDEVPKDVNKRELQHMDRLEHSALLGGPFFPGDLQLQCNLSKNSTRLFADINKLILKFMWKKGLEQLLQKKPEKDENSHWRTTHFKTNCEVRVIQTESVGRWVDRAVGRTECSEHTQVCVVSGFLTTAQRLFIPNGS